MKPKLKTCPKCGGKYLPDQPGGYVHVCGKRAAEEEAER